MLKELVSDLGFRAEGVGLQAKISRVPGTMAD